MVAERDSSRPLVNAESNASAKIDQVKPIPHFKAKQRRTYSENSEIYISKIIACLFWIYLLFQVFITNVDDMLLSWLPSEFNFVVRYKFLIFLGLILIVLRWMPRGRSFFYLIYFVTFPVVQLIKIPVSVFKMNNTTLSIAFINAIFSMFSDFRKKAIMWISLIFAFVFIVITGQPFWNIMGLIITTLLLAVIHWRAFFNSFKPAELIRRYLVLFQWINTDTRHKFFSVESNIRDLPVEELTETQVDQRNTKIELSVVCNRLCVFASRKMLDFDESGWKLLPSCFSILLLIIANITLFAMIYFALFKISPAEFTLQVQPRFFEFLYFSFNNLIFNTISEISVVGDISRSLYLIQVFLIFVIVLIFATNIVSLRNEKFSRELKNVAVHLQSTATTMEGHINSEFGIQDIDRAMDTLASSASDTILKLVLKYTSEISDP